LVDIRGYELPTNLQNFMQNELTEVFLAATFFETPSIWIMQGQE